MPRSVNHVASRAKRKRILKLTRGYFGARKNVWTVAKNTWEKGLTYAYRDRRNKKRTFRALCPRFCSELGLDTEAQNKALEILDRSEHMSLSSGRIPTGIAAGAIFLSTVLCGQHRTKKSISDVTGVTEVTIRHRSQELMDVLGIDASSLSI